MHFDLDNMLLMLPAAAAAAGCGSVSLTPFNTYLLSPPPLPAHTLSGWVVRCVLLRRRLTRQWLDRQVGAERHRGRRAQCRVIKCGVWVYKCGVSGAGRGGDASGRQERNGTLGIRGAEGVRQPAHVAVSRGRRMRVDECVSE